MKLNNMTKHLPVFLIFIFTILGCASTETVESTKVAPNEIYQDYSIQSSKNSTRITATFRVGGSRGSTIDLDAPSKIDYNGVPMTESSAGFLKGTTYNSNLKEFLSQHKFSFTDATGKVWQNDINLDALEINSKDVAISIANGGTITLSRPVGKDEEIEFLLVSEKTPPPSQGNSNANDKNRSVEPVYSNTLKVDLDGNRTTAKIEPSSLKYFVDGKANLSVTVKKTKQTQQSAKGGQMDFSYESQKVSANVAN